MTIQDVIKKIEGYHPDLGPSYKGCDGIKCGNPDVECTGIVTALVPTVDVIKKTAELGYNMLYVHEPIIRYGKLILSATSMTRR